MKSFIIYTPPQLLLKSKAVPLHAMEALGGRGDIAPTHSRQIKSRRMRWAGHVAPMGEECTRFSWESQKRVDLENQGVDGRMG
jgi:hypothetical protein